MRPRVVLEDLAVHGLRFREALVLRQPLGGAKVGRDGTAGKKNEEEESRHRSRSWSIGCSASPCGDRCDWRPKRHRKALILDDSGIHVIVEAGLAAHVVDGNAVPQ
jgi:hypothetical protein